jgi:predicted DNA-binding transcriptional regulator AlpA
MLLDAKAVAQALGIGVRTLYRLIASEIFPRPDVSVGRKIRRWKHSTIETWIIDRSRDGGRDAE